MKRMWGVLIGLFVFLAVLLSLTFLEENSEKEVSKGNQLFRMDITLKDMSYDDFKDGDKETIYYGNKVKIYDDTVFEVENVALKGRGNSTWSQDKKPLQIEFEGKIDLFGMGKSKEWVLLANALDDSNLRNETAFYLEYMLNEQNAIREEPVEIYVNDVYKGLYFLTRRIKIRKDFIDVKNNDGLLVELDNLNNKDDKCYFTENNNCLVLKDSVSNEFAEEAMERFTRDFSRVEKNAKEGNWDDLNKLIDVKSFAEYFLLSEFTINPDAYSSSLYFYRDGKNDKIHVGPGWDFDYAFANERWVWGEGEKNSPDVFMASKDRETLIFRLFYDLMDIPEFAAEVRNIFINRLYGRKGELLRKIESKRALIRETAVKNNLLWELNDFDDCVDELIDWVGERYDFLESKFSRKLRISPTKMI